MVCKVEIPRFWRLQQSRYNLIGEICPHCETKMFPARDLCLGCNEEVPKDLRPVSEIIYQAPSSDQASMSSK